MTQAKYILIEKEWIIFINPIFPFIKKKKLFIDYDYYITVDEHSRGGIYQAIWLIKDNKLKDRISSFYYTNYIDIKKSIGIKYNGKLRMNPFMQILYLTGMKIKN